MVDRPLAALTATAGGQDVRVLPQWEIDYANTFADELKSSGENEAHEHSSRQMIEAASTIKSLLAALARSQPETVHCILCANGNDLPEGEFCRACGRQS